MKCQK